MDILIVASNRDKAALNIAGNLIESYQFRETNASFDGKLSYKKQGVTLIFSNRDSVSAEDLGKQFNVDEIIFASRHTSASKEPMLTAHVPGNLSDQAVSGGNPKEVAWANALRIKTILQHLAAHKQDVPIYKICQEATHHGPTSIKVPVTFVEIGSTEKEWLNDTAGKIVASAIMSSISELPRSTPAVGLGGLHYATAFTKVNLEQSIAIGHIIPKYALEWMDDRAILDVLKKNKPPCELAVLDWKGLRGRDKERILKILESVGIEILKV